MPFRGVCYVPDSVNVASDDLNDRCLEIWLSASCLLRAPNAALLYVSCPRKRAISGADDQPANSSPSTNSRQPATSPLARVTTAAATDNQRRKCGAIRQAGPLARCPLPAASRWQGCRRIEFRWPAVRAASPTRHRLRAPRCRAIGRGRPVRIVQSTIALIARHARQTGAGGGFGLWMAASNRDYLDLVGAPEGAPNRGFHRSHQCHC